MQAVVRMCEPAAQQPDGGAGEPAAADGKASQAAASPELVERLASELGSLLGDEESDIEPILAPEVRVPQGPDCFVACVYPFAGLEACQPAGQ